MGTRKEVNGVNVLVLPVGYSKGFMPFLLRELNPMVCHYIVTVESYSGFEPIMQSFPNIQFKKHVIEDPKDVGRVAKDIFRIVKNIKNDESGKIVVDITGSTKPMTASLLLTASLLNIGATYVDVKYDKDKKPIPGTERLISVDPVLKTSGYSLLNTLDVLYTHWEYLSCFEVSEGTVIGDIFNTLFLGLSEIELFNYQKAKEDLRRSIVRLERISKINSQLQLEEELEWISSLIDRLPQKNGVDQKNIQWLYINMERKARRGMYDDAILRAYRCLEMIIQLRLKKYGIENTSNVPISKLPEEFRRRYGDETTKLTAMKGLEVLYLFGDSLGRRFYEEFREGSVIMNIRNYSYLAHGCNPIDGKKYSKVKGKIEEIMKEAGITIPDENEINYSKPINFMKFMWL
ncbi:MAG: TIGR02710 family CRISPR-associated protein [Candidatus Diapherotrites archaeon]|nr:TIGR02710 family CRISPR-associated protein [Candidatus Diapherotrites archaeon]